MGNDVFSIYCVYIRAAQMCVLDSSNVLINKLLTAAAWANFFIPALSLSRCRCVFCCLAPRFTLRYLSRSLAGGPGRALIINLLLPKAGGVPLFVVVNINMRQWVARLMYNITLP